MYDKAIHLGESDPNVFNNKGLSYHNLKLYDQALRMYYKAIQLNSLYSQAYNNKEISLDALKQHDQAIKTMIQLLIIHLIQDFLYIIQNNMAKHSKPMMQQNN